MIAVAEPVSYSPPELPTQPWYFRRAGIAGRRFAPVWLRPDSDRRSFRLRRGFVTPASGNNPLPKVLDQAVGFLAVHGTRVIRMRRRCPMMWFANVQVAFEWYRGRNYFVRHFLGTDPTDPPWIPPQIGPVIPFGNMATAGRLRWSQIEGICREWPDPAVGIGQNGL